LIKLKIDLVSWSAGPKKIKMRIDSLSPIINKTSMADRRYVVGIKNDRMTSEKTKTALSRKSDVCNMMGRLHMIIETKNDPK